jgi:phosphoribosyl-ATP pyrophosphohydrolase/phosphoribosyl-AMP cyclohydrolase
VSLEFEAARGVAALDFEREGGFVTCVTQDAVTGAVLMVARMNWDALRETLETGEMHYWSRTRGRWRKGETSGNVQHVVSLHADCDGDVLLARVRPAGPACHTGAVSCFEGAGADALSELAATITKRANGAEAPSYTRRLLDDRNLRLKKLAEEAGELAVACADGDRVRAREEAADLMYHMLVALSAVGVTIDDVRAVLHERSRS